MPDAAADRAELGWSMLTEIEDPARAAEVFLEALAADPHCAAAHCGLSVAYALRGDVARAYAFARTWHDIDRAERATDEPVFGDASTD